MSAINKLSKVFNFRSLRAVSVPISAYLVGYSAVAAATTGGVALPVIFAAAAGLWAVNGVFNLKRAIDNKKEDKTAVEPGMFAFGTSILAWGLSAASPVGIVIGAGELAINAILESDKVLLKKTGRPLFDRFEGDNSYQWNDIGNALKKLPGAAKNKAFSEVKKLAVKRPHL